MTQPKLQTWIFKKLLPTFSHPFSYGGAKCGALMNCKSTGAI